MLMASCGPRSSLLPQPQTPTFHISSPLVLQTDIYRPLLRPLPVSSEFIPNPTAMPGTIQVSVLDLMEPPPSASPTPADAKTSSLSLKVTMGKREYQTTGKGELSFPVVSLRENLVVMLYSLDGNLMFRTEFKTMSVVEKGILDDKFPLEGGGIVHLRLQFLLSKEERLRIHELRNSKLGRQHGELTKEGLESNVSGEKVTEMMPTYNVELKIEGSEIGQPKHVDQDECSDPSSTQSLQHPEKNSRDSFENKGQNKRTSATEGVRERDIFLEDSSDRQREHAALLIPGNVTEEITPFSTKLEDHIQRSEKNLLARSTRSNVRKMISVFEHSPSQGLGHRVGSSTSLVSKDQIEGSLKRTSSEESIEKRLFHQTMAKSFSAETLSDIYLQDNSKILRSHHVKKQEGKHLEHATKSEGIVKNNQFLDLERKVKNIGSEQVSESGNTYFLEVRKAYSIMCPPKDFSANEDEMKAGVFQKKVYDLVSDYSKAASDRVLSAGQEAFGAEDIINSVGFVERVSEGEDNISMKVKTNHNSDTNVASGNSDGMPSSRNGGKLKGHDPSNEAKPRMDKAEACYITTDQNVGNALHPYREINVVVHKNENKCEDHEFLKETKLSRNMTCEPVHAGDPCGTGTCQQERSINTVIKDFYCRFCRGHLKEQLATANSPESTELFYTWTEEHLLGTFGIWVPRHLCITTGSKQLRNLLERCSRCRICLGSLSVEEKFMADANEKEKIFSDSSVAVTRNENISLSPGKLDHKDLVGSSSLKGRLIDQGVRIIIVIVACGTLLLRTR